MATTKAVKCAADGGNLRPGWEGFDDRIFLTEAERETYARRGPVRYIKKRIHTYACQVCGKTEGPRQWAHKIPFTLGVQKYGFTPDYLDSEDNVISTCAVLCNKLAELSEAQIEKLKARLLKAKRKPTQKARSHGQVPSR